MYYRDYECEIINCTRCNKEPSSRKEEYFDMQNLEFPNYLNHAAASWAFCYNNNCPIYISEKERGDYFSKLLK
jgi:hypothetical protein